MHVVVAGRPEDDVDELGERDAAPRVLPDFSRNGVSDWLGRGGMKKKPTGTRKHRENATISSAVNWRTRRPSIGALGGGERGLRPSGAEVLLELGGASSCVQPPQSSRLGEVVGDDLIRRDLDEVVGDLVCDPLLRCHPGLP